LHILCVDISFKALRCLQCHGCVQDAAQWVADGSSILQQARLGSWGFCWSGDPADRVMQSPHWMDAAITLQASMFRCFLVLAM
jgi:hypothetical protein